MDFIPIESEDTSKYILISSESEDEEIQDKEISSKKEIVPVERISPPATNNFDYTFRYLDESYSIMTIMEKVVPPSALQQQLNRMITDKRIRSEEASRKWYEMWFYLCNPKCTFWDQYNACVNALNEWNEPRGFKVHDKLVEEEIVAADISYRNRIYQAKKDAEKYGVPLKFLVKKEHLDGKDRSNPTHDPAKFYYSYLRTTIESMDIDTSTKVGSSRRPVCKMIYHQNCWLNAKGNRSTDPTKYRLELFIGPFVSEDDSRDFNMEWKKHRGAQPRRMFAIKYAKDRNMLCVDMRSDQKNEFIDDLRKMKKAKKEVTFLKEKL